MAVEAADTDLRGPQQPDHFAQLLYINAEPGGIAGIHIEVHPDSGTDGPVRMALCDPAHLLCLLDPVDVVDPAPEQMLLQMFSLDGPVEYDPVRLVSDLQCQLILHIGHDLSVSAQLLDAFADGGGVVGLVGVADMVVRVNCPEGGFDLPVVLFKLSPVEYVKRKSVLCLELLNLSCS